MTPFVRLRMCIIKTIEEFYGYYHGLRTMKYKYNTSYFVELNSLDKEINKGFDVTSKIHSFFICYRKFCSFYSLSIKLVIVVYEVLETGWTTWVNNDSFPRGNAKEFYFDFHLKHPSFSQKANQFIVWLVHKKVQTNKT